MEGGVFPGLSRAKAKVRQTTSRNTVISRKIATEQWHETEDLRRNSKSTVNKNDADGLFSIVDVDGDGTLSKDEFKRLHSLVVENTRREVHNEHVMANKAKKAKRVSGALLCMLVAVMSFLAISVAANGILVSKIVDKSVRF